jgi:hypothetical protein
MVRNPLLGIAVIVARAANAVRIHSLFRARIRAVLFSTLRKGLGQPQG